MLRFLMLFHASLDRERSWRLVFISLVLILGILLPLLSFSYGITWDEWKQANRGIEILKYTLSHGSDTTYFDSENGYLYTQILFNLSGLFYGLATGDLHSFLDQGFFQDPHLLPFFRLSHIVNAFFGVFLFVFAGLTAKEIRGWRAACLGLILMALTPRIFGHTMNNPKDIPFAAMMLFATWG